MGQAKNRKAEIDALKAQGPKVKPGIEGFRPDAGLNSNEGENHYWFSVAELIGDLSSGPGMKSYTMPRRDNTRYVEMNASADIMDYEGKTHLSPQTERGYFATLRFTTDSLHQLANEIDKGAMSVRITGTPSEIETSSGSGEKFRIIDVKESWSAGNNSGHMTYAIYTGTKAINTSSKAFADWLRHTADDMLTKVA